MSIKVVGIDLAKHYFQVCFYQMKTQLPQIAKLHARSFQTWCASFLKIHLLPWWLVVGLIWGLVQFKKRNFQLDEFHLNI